MADRIAVMRDGVSEQVDTPHKIFSQPRNLFVAGFIATLQMNLVPATLQACDSGKGHFRVGGQELLIDVDPAVDKLAAGDITLGIRPRGVDFTNADEPGAFAARVDLTEPMGAETLAHLIGLTGPGSGRRRIPPLACIRMARVRSIRARDRRRVSSHLLDRKGI